MCQGFHPCYMCLRTIYLLPILSTTPFIYSFSKVAFLFSSGCIFTKYFIANDLCKKLKMHENLINIYIVKTQVKKNLKVIVPLCGDKTKKQLQHPLLSSKKAKLIGFSYFLWACKINWVERLGIF